MMLGCHNLLLPVDLETTVTHSNRPQLWLQMDAASVHPDLAMSSWSLLGNQDCSPKRNELRVLTFWALWHFCDSESHGASDQVLLLLSLAP